MESLSKMLLLFIKQLFCSHSKRRWLGIEWGGVFVSECNKCRKIIRKDFR